MVERAHKNEFHRIQKKPTTLRGASRWLQRNTRDRTEHARSALALQSRTETKIWNLLPRETFQNNKFTIKDFILTSKTDKDWTSEGKDKFFLPQTGSKGHRLKHETHTNLASSMWRKFTSNLNKTSNNRTNPIELEMTSNTPSHRTKSRTVLQRNRFLRWSDHPQPRTVAVVHNINKSQMWSLHFTSHPKQTRTQQPQEQ